MDETHQSRISDAAATRKRRSSILKSQRPPRTPFSELEFNVATPTDTTKSRRVSFSRRTGVAEFVTNEATTTWKNFYEEHNKSLELSGNESGARQPVGHIGQTMFDRQFQEVEAVDFITSLDNLACRNVNTSLNNFTNQLALLENTSDDGKLLAPQSKFERSALTEQQSNFFGDDLAIPIMGEISGRINVNFSAMQTISGDIGDDLDEIQRDLETVQRNVVGPQPFRNGRDLSEYIEVELNSTHIGLRNEESDMSITETIQSPKVQDVSRTNISTDKKPHLINDLDLDKENKWIPDIEAKLEDFYEMDDLNADMSISSDFPTNVAGSSKNEPEKIKTKVLQKNSENRTTLLFDDEMGNLSINKSISAKLPLQSEVINSNAYNLSPFEPSNSCNADSMKKTKESTSARRRTIVYGRDDIDADMSVTVAIPQNIYEDSKKNEKRNTIVFDFENADMSITMAVPQKNVEDASKQAERHKMVFDDEIADDISLTKPIPAKLLSVLKEVLSKSTTEGINLTSENNHSKRHTIFDDEMADISMTKPIPAKLFSDHREILKKSTADDFNLTSNNNQSKRHTIVFDDDMADISMTKPIPAKLLSDHKEMLRKSTSVDINTTSDNKQNKRHTIVFDDNMADISMTKPIPAKLLSDHKEMLRKSTSIDMNIVTSDNKQGKRHTIVFDDEMADISMTKPIPAKFLSDHEVLNQLTTDDINLTSNYNGGKRHTIVFDDEMADISMTKPIPAKLLSDHEVTSKSTTEDINLTSSNNVGKRHTIVFNDEMADISMTKPIPAKLLSDEVKRKSSSEDINLTSNNKQNKRHTIVFDDVMGDISMTKPIPAKLLSGYEVLSKSTAEDINLTSNNKQVKRHTIVFDHEMADLSMTKPISTQLLSKSAAGYLNLTDVKETGNDNNSSGINQNAFTVQVTDTSSHKLTDKIEATTNHTIKNVEMDMSITDIINIPTVEVTKDNLDTDSTMSAGVVSKNMKDARTGQILDRQNKGANMSVIVALNQENTQNLTSQEKRNTIVFDDETDNISITKPIPAKILFPENEILSKTTRDSINLTHDIKNSAYQDVDPDVIREPSVFQTVSVPRSQNLGIDMKEILRQTDSVRDEEMDKSIADVIDIPKSTEVQKNDSFITNISISIGGTDTKKSNDRHSVMLERQDEINIKKMKMLITDVIDTPNNGEVMKDNSIIINNILTGVESTDTRTTIDKHSVTLDGQGEEDVLLDEQNKKSVVINEDSEIPMIDNQAMSGQLLPIQTEILSLSTIRDLSNLQQNKHSTSHVFVSDVNQSMCKSVIMESSPILPTNDIENKSNCTLENKEIEMSIIDIANGSQLQSKMKNDKISTVSNISIDSDNKTIEAADNRKSEQCQWSERSNEDRISVAIPIFEKSSENMVKQEKIKKDEKKLDKELGVISISKEIPAELVSVTSQIDELCNADIVTVSCTKNENENIVYTELKRKSIATNTKSGVSTNISIREVIQKRSVVDGSGKRKTITFEDEVDLAVTSTVISKLMPTENDAKLSQDNNSASNNVIVHTNKDIVVCKVLTDENSEVKIPPYLKSVSEEIKSLMNDLVKPMADVMPFGSTLDDNLKKPSSTCNTEIQADLVTSSQIDLSDLKMTDVKPSDTDFNKTQSFVSSKNEVDCESYSAQNKINSPDCPSDKSSKVDIFNIKEISIRPQRAIPENTVPGGDLIFDYSNPLNNVLLIPSHVTEVHKYNPTRSNDTLCGSEHSNSVQCAMSDTEVQNVSVHFGIENENTDDVNNVMIPDTQSLISNISKSGSIDQSVDAKIVEVKDIEVNTLIVMKENTELLQASSSLTLVDDAVASDMLDGNIDTQSTNSQTDVSEKITSPVQVICKDASGETSIQNDSDMTSNDEEMNAPQNTSKSKKRNYSPTKQVKCENSSEYNLEVTPKPISKMKKISNSPNTLKNLTGVHFNEEDILNNEVKDTDLDRTSRKDQKKSPRKANLDVTAKTISKTQKISNSPNTLKNKTGVHLNEDIPNNEVEDMDLDESSEKYQKKSRGKFNLEVTAESISEINMSNSPNTLKNITEVHFKEEDIPNNEVKETDLDKTSVKDQKESPRKSNLNVTAKPISKTQNVSNSPNTSKNITGLHFNKEDVTNNEVEEMDLDKTSVKDQKESPQKSKASKKPGTSITVQQLLTEYNINSNIDQKILNEKILEALNQSGKSMVPNSQSDVSGIQSPDLVGSFTSSKYQGEMNAKDSELRLDCETMEPNVSSVLPTEMNASISRLSECESSLNVVAKINMLPFMGSHECSWESSGIDSWSFLLLHARLRLLVRLQHHHHNAARTRVRADTPVRALSVQRVHDADEDKNPVANVCVGFAAEAVQRLSASCAVAGDVPTLLKAAASTARHARIWARDMHRARLHLAYKINDQGLTLNVANIPLRCLWEVHMRLEMSCEAEGSIPWPRACHVQVTNVLTGDSLPAGELQRLLARMPHDWGHVPSALWQIFKHLKNKTHDNQFLGI